MRGPRFEETGAGPFWRWGDGPRRGGPGSGPRGFGPGWFGPGGSGFGSPPWARGPKARRGDVRAAALSLLAEGPRNGYQIIQEVAERSGGMWRPSPGSVYPALQQLQDEGLVRSEEGGGQRAYHLTDAGRAYVDGHAEELAAPWRQFDEGVPQGVHDLWHIGRGLITAAVQVAHAGDEAQVAEAARVLADARRALYRILAEADPEDETDA